MGKPPSQRQKDHAKRNQARWESERRSRRRKRWYAGVALVAMVALLLGTVAAGIGGLNDDEDVSTTGSTVQTSSSVPGPPPVSVTAPPPGETLTGETPCPAPDGSAPRVTTFAGPPPMCIDPAKRYFADIETSVGPLTVLLNNEQAPQTVNNFVVLSRYHYYDGLPIFAIIPLQAFITGDATGDPQGTGSPGYTIPDEIPEAGVLYQYGTVAMWNDGTENSGGSQFFVGTGEQVAGLPPVYTVFGQVTGPETGTDTVRAIENGGDPSGSGQPVEEILIERVTIREEDAPA